MKVPKEVFYGIFIKWKKILVEKLDKSTKFNMALDKLLEERDL